MTIKALSDLSSESTKSLLGTSGANYIRPYNCSNMNYGTIYSMWIILNRCEGCCWDTLKRGGVGNSIRADLVVVLVLILSKRGGR